MINMIEVQGVYKSFQLANQTVEVLKNINLDSRSGQEVLELLRDINQEKGITILMVTHSQESTQYGHRIIRLRDSEIVS